MLINWEKRLHLLWTVGNAFGLVYVWLSYDPILEDKLLSIVTSTDAIVFSRWLFVMSIILQVCALLLRKRLEQFLNALVDDVMRAQEATTSRRARAESVFVGQVLLAIGALLGTALVVTGAVNAEQYNE